MTKKNNKRPHRKKVPKLQRTLNNFHEEAMKTLNWRLAQVQHNLKDDIAADTDFEQIANRHKSIIEDFKQLAQAYATLQDALPSDNIKIMKWPSADEIRQLRDELSADQQEADDDNKTTPDFDA